MSQQSNCIWYMGGTVYISFLTRWFQNTICVYTYVFWKGRTCQQCLLWFTVSQNAAPLRRNTSRFYLYYHHRLAMWCLWGLIWVVNRWLFLWSCSGSLITCIAWWSGQWELSAWNVELSVRNVWVQITAMPLLWRWVSPKCLSVSVPFRTEFLIDMSDVQLFRY